MRLLRDPCYAGDWGRGVYCWSTFCLWNGVFCGILSWSYLDKGDLSVSFVVVGSVEELLM